MFTNYHLNKKLKQMTTKSEMLKRFGGKKVVLSNAITYSHDKKHVTLREYV